MRLIDCVNAYMAAEEMSRRELGFRTAYAIVNLKRKLRPHADFYAGEEMKLVERCARKNRDGKIEIGANGRFEFDSPEKAGEYNKLRAELGDMEAGELFEKIKAPAPAEIKPAELEALGKFIEFEEENA